MPLIDNKLLILMALGLLILRISIKISNASLNIKSNHTAIS